MHQQSKSAVAVWSAKFAAVMIAVVLISGATATAQVKVRLQRVVPRFIRGHAVESTVINHVVLVFGDARIAGKGPIADDGDGEHPAPRPQRVILFSGTFDELVFGIGSNADEVQAQLNKRLRETLEKIDRISQLTDAQREKLQLAGRGDIKRFFDRADNLRVMCDRYAEITALDQFQKWTEDLRREAHALQKLLAEGPIDAQSLMGRTMKKTLTADQSVKYARYEATPPYQPPQRGFIGLEGAIELGGR